MNKAEFGRFAEEEVARYLELVAGLWIVDRNAHFREGELDIVALHPPTGQLYFVEVKACRNEDFGAVVERLTVQKLRRMRRAIYAWRQRCEDFRPGQKLFVGFCSSGEGAPKMTLSILE